MIHVVCVDISQMSQADYERLYTSASAQRKRQADRCLRQADKRRCVTADALLRYVVRKTLSVTKFEIEQGPFGKPCIKDAEHFHYNLSHSGSWVVIAYGDSPVGIDVEQLRRMDDKKENIARRCFTADEQAYIFQSAENHQGRFFQIWTAKESYLKYLGTGLRRSLDSFCVVPDGAHLGVQLHCTSLPGHCMTLCTQDAHITTTQMNIHQFMEQQ